jgi:Asp-tRNA(Asn)/Glu-tRNA(Gln) amidotransferase C subunit
MIKGTPELIAQRREEIVNACEELYQTMSFKDITLKEIGQVTSFSRPTIYNYFQTKEEIFLALYQREYERWNEALERILRENDSMTHEQLADAIAHSLEERGQLLKLLAMKKFIIPFESGIVVIKHWKIHNYIRNDRYKETKYKDEKSQLALDENNSYTTCAQIVGEVDTIGIPNDNQMDTQDRLGKDRLGKESIDNILPAPKPKKPTKHKYGEYKNVLLTDEELEKLQNEYSDYAEYIERLSSYVASTGKSYKSHYATIRNWARKEAQNPQQKRKEIVPEWMNKPKKNSFQDYDSNEDSEFERQLLQKRVERLKAELGVAE